MARIGFLIRRIGLQFVVGAALTATAVAQIPTAAWSHRAEMTKSAYRVWGPSAPIATLAAQIHQESAWKLTARSWVGAEGLAQFMPATAADMARLYPHECAPANPFSARWAFSCRDRYLKSLLKSSEPAASACDLWSFGFSAYNGGLGNLRRERRACTGASVSNAFCVAGAAAETTALTDVLRIERHHDVTDFTSLALAGIKRPPGSPNTVSNLASVFRVSPTFFGHLNQPGPHLGWWRAPFLTGQLFGHFLSGFGAVGFPVEVILGAKPTVFSVVFTETHHGQILRPEVTTVMVAMMHDYSAIQLMSHDPFRHEAMDVLGAVLPIPFSGEPHSRIAVEQKDFTVGQIQPHKDLLQFHLNRVVHEVTQESVDTGNVAPCPCDPNRWKGHVELTPRRNTAATRENREYPIRIYRIAPRYAAAGWGSEVPCG